MGQAGCCAAAAEIAATLHPATRKSLKICLIAAPSFRSARSYRVYGSPGGRHPTVSCSHPPHRKVRPIVRRLRPDSHQDLGAALCRLPHLLHSTPTTQLTRDSRASVLFFVRTSFRHTAARLRCCASPADCEAGRPCASAWLCVLRLGKEIRVDSLDFIDSSSSHADVKLDHELGEALAIDEDDTRVNRGSILTRIP